MSIELKNFNNKISIVLLLLILNNYLLLSIGLFNIILKINLLLFFFFIAYFYAKHFKNNLILKIYFVLILLISLGTPAEGWDLRSLYLFHAKRIFFDQSIYSVADNYAAFSHNDYPLLFHGFSASFAFLTGYWHEIFPKSAYSFIYLPPLIFLSTNIPNKKNIVFLSLVIFFIGSHLYDGGIDGAVALYFITSVYCFFKMFFSKNSEDNTYLNFTTFLMCLTLSLIKNEGFALLILIFLITILIKLTGKDLSKHFKKLFILSLSLIPFIIWKIFCYKNGIVNTDFTFALLNENLIDRLSLLKNYKLFFEYLIISNEKSIIALLIFAVSFYLNFNTKLFYFVSLLFLSYLTLLLIVYFSTPYDFTYHLETSAHRVLESLTLLLGFFALYNLNIKALKETS